MGVKARWLAALRRQAAKEVRNERLEVLNKWITRLEKMGVRDA